MKKSNSTSSFPRTRSIRERFVTNGSRVGLKPEKGWARRNYQYLSKSLFPAMVKRRKKSATRHAPIFDPLEPGQIEICWIGHASFLLRTTRFNALIDPVWAKWVGPIKRTREAGLRIADLPPIDLILITHAHFDHLCMRTLRKIVDGSQTVLVPSGVAKVLRRLDLEEVVEMSEWDNFSYRGGNIVFTPAFHWGARFIHDTHRGFGGYLVESEGHHVYHAGDSAYFEGFKQIAERFRVDTALLPIGAYDCPSGREVHMNPEEAVRVFKELNAQRMIPMHYATFPISNEKMCEPLRRLRAEVSAQNLQDRLIAPTEGDLLLFGGP